MFDRNQTAPALTARSIHAGTPRVSSSLKIILRNAPSSDHFDDRSFVGRLAADGVFAIADFADVEAALATLVSARNDDEWFAALPFVFAIYSRVADLMAAHVDPQDVYSVRNLTDDMVRELRVRLTVLFESFFARVPPESLIP